MQMPFNAPRQPWYTYSEVFQEKDHMGILDKYIAYNELGHHQYTQPAGPSTPSLTLFTPTSLLSQPHNHPLSQEITTASTTPPTQLSNP